jgi:hypothetical protein
LNSPPDVTTLIFLLRDSLPKLSSFPSTLLLVAIIGFVLNCLSCRLESNKINFDIIVGLFIVIVIFLVNVNDALVRRGSNFNGILYGAIFSLPVASVFSGVKSVR